MLKITNGVKDYSIEIGSPKCRNDLNIFYWKQGPVSVLEILSDLSQNLDLSILKNSGPGLDQDKT